MQQLSQTFDALQPQHLLKQNETRVYFVDMAMTKK
jgi:hypothetical protein